MNGKEIDAGSSGNIPGEPEEVLIEEAKAGSYIARVINYAAVTPQWTLTVGVYGTTQEVLAKGTTERWTLTCESTSGKVLASRKILIDRGKSAKISLTGC